MSAETDLPIQRHLLEKYFGEDPRLVTAFEEQSQAVRSLSEGVPATDAMRDATVIVLSSNGDFTNEFVLDLGFGITYDIEPGLIRLRIDTDEIVAVAKPKFGALGNFANDAAAAAGGVAVGEAYRNGSVLMQRIV